MMDFTVCVSIVQLFLKGFFIGLIVSAPMGPVGILCIRRTIKKGRLYGLVTGFGASLSDVIYAVIVGCGMTFVIDFFDNEHNLFVMKLIGGAMLFFFGLYMFKTSSLQNIHPASNKKGTLTHNFVTAFLVTFSNPLIIFLFIALYNMFTFVIPPDNIYLNILAYVSILLGADFWWLGLTTIINRMKRNFGPSGIVCLNRFVGSIVLLVSVIYISLTISKLSII